MRQPSHLLSDRDYEQRTATCSICGPGAKINKHGKDAKGNQRWLCSVAFLRRWRTYCRTHTTLIPKDKCSRCGFLPEDPCQLDIDHIDGDHKNNELTNLQVLCANCHRLKTRQAGDGFYGMVR